MNIGEEKKQNPKGTTVVGARKVKQQTENVQAAVLRDGKQPMARESECDQGARGSSPRQRPHRY